MLQACLTQPLSLRVFKRGTASELAEKCLWKLNEGNSGLTMAQLHGKRRYSLLFP